jgi:hypothetical protein
MPDGKMYCFHGKAALGKLLAGAVTNGIGVPGRNAMLVVAPPMAFSVNAIRAA